MGMQLKINLQHVDPTMLKKLDDFTWYANLALLTIALVLVWGGGILLIGVVEAAKERLSEYLETLGNKNE